MVRPVANPPNPWESTHHEWIGEPPPARLDVYEEEARSILSRNESPDIPFRWSLNPYRGCFHACAYCYARPTHQYLGFGAGTDFDRRIVVKTNAPELVRAAFGRRSWQRETVTFSGVTDCYQPLEASYRLTRRCLEECLAFRNPVGIITKGMLIRRDLDVLHDLHRVAGVAVYVSIPFLEDDMARRIEPYVPSPARRLETLAILAEAGLRVGIAIAPIIPGLNESHIPGLLERARAAGASAAFVTLLRLPAEVRRVFVDRLREAFPERAGKVLRAIEDVRGGRLNDPGFGERMRGKGPRWAIVERMFETHCRRLGIETRVPAELRVSPGEGRPRQRGLFDR